MDKCVLYIKTKTPCRPVVLSFPRPPSAALCHGPRGALEGTPQFYVLHLHPLPPCGPRVQVLPFLARCKYLLLLLLRVFLVFFFSMQSRSCIFQFELVTSTESPRVGDLLKRIKITK